VPDQPPSKSEAELAPELEARLRASVARQTMLTTLGVTVGHFAPGHVELGLTNRPALTQQHGFLHAGALTTIADSACGYAVYTLMPEDRDVLTVDFTMNLLAPAVQPDFVAVGHVSRSGRTISICRCEVYGIEPDGGRTTVALMQATLMAVTRLSSS
jgi:uncharacterized protein (TIGR00369 family)